MEERCGRRTEYVAKGSDSSAEKKITKNDLLQKALKDREQFLKQNPRLQSYQAEIDRLLDNSGNSQGRMAVLATLMQGKLLELQKELCTLTAVLANDANADG
ncbi:conserved uncharacterized protein, DUF3135 [Desulfosarcina variabilis str. Montpellier]|uniref:DUF3135 domain-containing protein n=1 Tax=Desulfosarcina variabilis TaxID=2300 RepID=UPI003AFB5013